MSLYIYIHIYMCVCVCVMSIYINICIYTHDIYIYIYICIYIYSFSPTKHTMKVVPLLYIDLRPGQTCHSKDGGSAYSIGVGELAWRCGTRLKSHGTITDWCTGREWPVNCMTIISAWWRSNMPFQRQRKWYIPMASYGELLSGRLNYYISVRTGSQIVWRPDPLVTRCGRGSLHPEEWATRPPVEQPWRARKRRWWP